MTHLTRATYSGDSDISGMTRGENAALRLANAMQACSPEPLCGQPKVPRKRNFCSIGSARFALVPSGKLGRLVKKLFLLLLVVLIPVLVKAATQLHPFSLLGHVQTPAEMPNSPNGPLLMLRPLVAPALTVRQTSGPALPEHGILNCTWRQEWQVVNGTRFPVMQGRCDNGVELRLVGIDLSN